MDPSKIYKSTFPHVDLVKASCYDFLYGDEFASLRAKYQVDPDKPAFIDANTKEEIKFGQLKSLTKRLAHALTNGASVKKDDATIIFSPNSIWFPITVHATMCAGAIPILSNAAYQTSEVVHQIKDSGAKHMLVAKSTVPIALQAAKEAGIPTSNIWFLEPSEKGFQGIKSVWSLASEEELEPVKTPRDEVQTKLAFMCYSSGTTGKPKGVESSHHNLTSVIQQLISMDPEMFSPTESFISFLPMFHIYGLVYYCFVTMFVGCTTVVMPKFNFTKYLSLIEDYKITWCHVVPPVAVSFAKSPLVAKYNLKSLKGLRNGAGPVGADIIDLIRKRTGVHLYSGYGMTESTCVVASATAENRKTGTCGKLLPNMEAKVQDGELLLRGPSISIGYHNNPKANAETYVDGWMRTGDVAAIDADNDLFIVDRIKELIKYKGFQVAPAELEDILLKHPKVRDVAVIGIDDPSQGTELPRAYITLDNDIRADPKVAEEIKSWLAERVSYQKYLRGGVSFLEPIPKSASGKILRRELKDRSKSEADAVYAVQTSKL